MNAMCPGKGNKPLSTAFTTVVNKICFADRANLRRRHNNGELK
jgi:hypothetical protein